MIHKKKQTNFQFQIQTWVLNTKWRYNMDETLLSKKRGTVAESSSRPPSLTSSRPPSLRELSSSYIDLITNEEIIQIITTPKNSPSYLNLIANLNRRRKIVHRSHSAPSVFTEARVDGHDSFDHGFSQKTSPRIVRLSFIGVILYVATGVLVYLVSGNFKGTSTYKPVDALYFTVVTLCTVGYGDIVPDTAFTKIFTCGFILVGFGFIGILLNGLVTKVCLALTVVVCCIAIGTICARCLEKLDWLDSFYLSVTSVTTVGYGDYAFTTEGGRCFASLWLLVSSLAVGRAFLYLTEYSIDKRNRSIAKWILHKKITLSDLVAADLDNDGSISKSEFVIYKLKEMGKITENDILQIGKQFDSLDIGQCGKITLADLMETA